MSYKKKLHSEKKICYKWKIIKCKNYAINQLNRFVAFCLPIALSCLEFVKNGRRDGFGVEPMEMLSISWPDSSPSPHDNDSSSWKNASRSRSPLNTPCPRRTSPSSSSGRKRFSSATIFCLKFRCWGMEIYDKIKLFRVVIKFKLTLLILFARDPFSFTS